MNKHNYRNKELSVIITKSMICLFVIAISCCSLSVLRAADDDPGTSGKHNGDIAINPIEDTEGYSAILYNNQNGLPTSEANDIVETSDGFIWIGSYSGLIRYDGSSFERIDSRTGIPNVKCLYVDSKDRLWIGTNSNGIAMMEKGEIRLWTREDGLKSSSIRSIIEDNEGRILAATTQGLLIFDQDLEFRYSDDPRVSDDFLHDLKKGADGTIYCVTNSGNVFLIWNGTIYRYFSFEDKKIKGINCLFPDPDDANLLYFETVDSNLYHDNLDNSVIGSNPIDIAPLSQIQVIDKFGDDIWICARNGIGIINETGFHLLENVPMNNSVSNMMTDYEGNLWFTSTRQGVMKIVPNRFSSLFSDYKLSSQVVNSTCIGDDKLFVATDNGLIVFKDGEQLDKLPLKSVRTASGEIIEEDDLISMLADCRIRSIIRDSKGRLWFSTWRRYGLLRYDDGDLTVFGTDEGLFSDTVRMVHERKDGSILVASTGGVNVIRDDEVVESYDENDGITNTEILNVAEGRNGDIIVGTDGGGIFILSDGKTVHIGNDEGLSSGAVMRIKYDDEHGVYWLVTGDSLSYMDEDYRIRNVTTFPYANNFDVYKNSRDELWVLSSNGIYVAKIAELLNDEVRNTVHYSMSNGMPCITTANSYSELTADGDLYISGATDVAKVNIEEDFENVSSLKAGVPFVEIDGRAIYPDENGTFILPSDFIKLAICGRVFTYSLAEPRVSYRLEDIDKYSFSGTARDIFPVYYTNMRGGHYRFIMDLMDPMGNVSGSYSFDIIKEKAFYEETWFYVAAVLLSGLLLYAAIRSYVNRRLNALEKKHREEEEKKRITNELSMASRIQQSMLPHIFPPFPDRKEFEIYATMDPAKGVGGDFYDFYMIDEDHLCLTMADVSGKGIPGALFMMISKIILQTFANSNASPAEILRKTNEMICSNNQEGMFVTVWLGILEISSGRLIAANAGHEYPAIKEPDGRFELLMDRHGFVIGGMDGMKYHEYEIELKKGSKLFLYTDGIPEATDSLNRMFGTDMMIEALNSDPDADPKQIIANVKEAVDAFVKDAEQFDDLTMLCFEYKGGKQDDEG